MPPNREAFVAQYLPYAQRWAEATGIPPEVLLAIGASETNWGNAGSLFGIKGVGPSGKSANYATHEIINGQRVDLNDQFAIYDNPDQGFQHFVDLVSKGRYEPAWDHLQATGDWQGFLNGLNRAGYATDPNWGNMIGGLAKTVRTLFGGPAQGAPAMPTAPEGLPPGTELIGTNLARWLDQTTGEFVYFRNNPNPYLDPVSGQIVPAGWVGTGSLPQPNAARQASPQGAVSEQELRQAGATFGVGTATLGNQKYTKNADGTWTASGSASTTAPQGAVTTEQLRTAGAQMGVGTATLNGQRYTQNPDGTWQPTGTPSTADANLSQSERIARANLNASRTNQEAQRIREGGAPASSGSQQTASSAPSDPMASTGVPPATGGGAAYRSQPRDLYGPDNMGIPGEFVGMEIPTDDKGGSTFRTAGPTGWAGQTLAAAGIVPTGDVQKDFNAAQGAHQRRLDMLATGMDPLQVQDFFDTQNLGKDVYTRAKAVSSMEQAADRALSGERVPAPGTDNLTASMLSQYVLPRPEEEGVYYPPPLPLAEGGSVTVDDDPFKALAIGRNAAGADAPLPGSVPVDRSAPGIPVEGLQDTRGSDINRIGSRGDSMPRYHANGLMSRDYGQGRVYMPMTGAGSWQTETRAFMPTYQDFLDQFWSGVNYPAGSPVNAQQQRMFFDMISSWGDDRGFTGPGIQWAGNMPRPWTNSRGETFDFAGRGGYGSSQNTGVYPTFGRGSFAQGGTISVDPMQVTGNGNHMVTDEPMIGVGAYSGAPRFTVGEPNALTGGMPTREVLSGGNGIMNVQPLEPSVPMPMTAPYKSRRSVPLVDPLQALRTMKV